MANPVKVDCSAFRFTPGDKVLVKTKRTLLPEQQRKIKDMVKRWAGSDIDVLIINSEVMDLEVITG